MDKAELLDNLEKTRREWEQVLADVGKEHMTEPGVEGDWSVKDVIAHVDTYAMWLADRVEKTLRGEKREPTTIDGVRIRDLSIDECNALIQKTNSERPLEGVLSRSQETLYWLQSLARDLTDEQINDPHAFKWTDGYAVCESFAGDAYEHYQEHAENIRRWLGSVNG
jgi:hypothetical protein